MWAPYVHIPLPDPVLTATLIPVLAPALAKDASPAWQVVTTVSGGLLSLVAAVLVAWFALRGNRVNADATRETAFDARVDKELSRLEAARNAAEDRERLAGEREEIARQALSQVREAYTQLRIAVWREGFDPDELVRKHGQP